MFEETLVCDGCLSIIDSGSRQQTLATLREQGGRAFDRGRRGLEELPADDGWARSRRHLCGRCADKDECYDGEPVPERAA